METAQGQDDMIRKPEGFHGCTVEVQGKPLRWKAPQEGRQGESVPGILQDKT